MTLNEVLAPLEVDEFLEKYVGQQYVVLQGTPGKFHRLLSWRDLNQALERLRVNDGRVSLVKNGRPVEQESYVQSSKSGRAQYLIGPSVSKHIASGATLVVNQVDELFSQIRALAESCEDVFQIYVSANLYAGWRKENGFKVHWDSHGTLILQVQGRKDWKVWRPTRLHPVIGEGINIAPTPAGDPVWEGVLQDGDVLYMPRGWWHVAWPRDEPSLHITVGINHPTGLDLLGWVVEQMREVESARKDVPLWHVPDVRAAWIRSLREACAAALSDDAVDRFAWHTAERAHSRPVVHLPESSLPTTNNVIDAATPLRLTRGRHLNVEAGSSAGMMSFSANGMRWHCHEGLSPALGLLSHLQPCTLRDMRSVTGARAMPLLFPFIMSLVMSDVVWAEPKGVTAPGGVVAPQ